MADFAPAFDELIVAEGGYELKTVAGDRGGATYAGIARNMNPDWPGWAYVDREEIPPTQLVRDFYRAGYWEPLHCDAIASQLVATSLLKIAVNTSMPGKPILAAQLLQHAAKVPADGFIGEKTVAAVNEMDAEMLLARFTLAQVARHVAICNKDRSRVQARTFLLGWMNRDLEGFTL
jgi:lysozyme family protein